MTWRIDELVEQTAQAMWERTHDGTWDREDGQEESKAIYREDAKIAVSIITASLSRQESRDAK